MDRFKEAFRKNAYVGYLTAGDGGIDYSIQCALALIQEGVNILEIGFPFSDPVADGPVIQKAHERALAKRITSGSILEIAKRLRQVTAIPLVLFSYYNPILQKGKEYLNQLKASGFDAVLIVDLPLPLNGTKEPFFDDLKKAGLLSIQLATPSTSDERLQQMAQVSEGFLYYVSQKGTTGIRAQLADDFAIQMARMRQYFQIPIAAGFGIADAASAKKVLSHADGFVVGSAFVKEIEKKIAPESLVHFARSLDPRERSS